MFSLSNHPDKINVNLYITGHSIPTTKKKTTNNWEFMFVNKNHNCIAPKVAA